MSGMTGPRGAGRRTRSMAMGSVASPGPYDAAARVSLQLAERVICLSGSWCHDVGGGGSDDRQAVYLRCSLAGPGRRPEDVGLRLRALSGHGLGRNLGAETTGKGCRSLSGEAVQAHGGADLLWRALRHQQAQGRDDRRGLSEGLDRVRTDYAVHQGAHCQEPGRATLHPG